MVRRGLLRPRRFNFPPGNQNRFSGLYSVVDMSAEHPKNEQARGVVRFFCDRVQLVGAELVSERSINYNGGLFWA